MKMCVKSSIWLQYIPKHESVLRLYTCSLSDSVSTLQGAVLL